MKCNRCGKDNIDRAIHCTSCGNRLQKELKESKEAKEAKEVRESAINTLIEFPAAGARDRRAPAITGGGDWRAELSERVRQVKERKNLQEARGKLQAELEAAQQRLQQSNNSAVPSGLTAPVPSAISMPSEALSFSESERHPNPIIDAALRRARRASEVAGKKQVGMTSGLAGGSLSSAAATAPKLTPHMHSQLQAQSVVKPKGLTSPLTAQLTEAKPQPQSALSLAIEIDLSEDTMLAPRLENETGVNAGTSRLPAMVDPAAMLSEEIETIFEGDEFEGFAPAEFHSERADYPEHSQFQPGVQITSPAAQSGTGSLTGDRPVRVIKESECAPNYLDELIAVCEQNLTNDYARYSQLMVAAVIDLIVSLLATGPFWALSYGMGVDLTDQRVWTMLGGATLIIMMLYQTLTVYSVARTFGMMFVGTHVINSNNGGPPSLFQAMLRSFGYLLSTALAGLGFLLIFTNKDHRALHDFISSTSVVRDY